MSSGYNKLDTLISDAYQQVLLKRGILEELRERVKADRKLDGEVTRAEMALLDTTIKWENLRDVKNEWTLLEVQRGRLKIAMQKARLSELP